MNIYLIYKQIVENGNVVRVDFIECDTNETNANKFSKLYNLQIPADLKNKISYNFIGARVS